jgi:hypothetical protein
VPELAERLGEACGVVLRHPDEKTLYLAGDTVWRDEVAADLQKHQPDVVVLNAAMPTSLVWAHYYGAGGCAQRSFPLPQANIVAIHMEAINHCLLTRSALREYVEANQVSDAVSIPQDGETVIF